MKSLQDIYTKYLNSEDIEPLKEMKTFCIDNAVKLPLCNVPETKTYDALAVSLYLKDMRNAAVKGKGWVESSKRISAMTTKALTEGTDSAGGILVPTELHRSLMALIEGESKILGYMSRFRMTTDKKTVPTADSKMSVSWHQEGDAITASDPSFGSAVLNTHRLDAYTKVSNELLMDDSIGIAGILAAQFAEQSAQHIDSTIFNGDGSDDHAGFSGIFTAAAGYSTVFGAGSTHFSEVLASNMIDCYKKVPSYVRGDAGKFFMHSDILTYLQKEKVDGKYLLNPYMTGESLRIHNIPIMQSHQCPDVSDSAASTALAVFCNPSYLIFGDRQQTESKVDPYSQSLNNQTVFIFLMRAALAWGYNSAVSRIVTAA